MGSMPHPENTEAEVLAYVKTLVAHDRIDYGGTKKKKKSTRRRGAGPPARRRRTRPRT
jgi:hypothetical protein